MRRFWLSAVLSLLPVWNTVATATPMMFPALNGNKNAQVLVVYSSLDEPLARPMIEGFQEKNPDITVRYEDMLTTEIYERIVRETDDGLKTADFAFSSAMDLQVKLTNDGYAQAGILPMSERWPAWANWRNTAYALTFEPAVFVYHKPDFMTERLRLPGRNLWLISRNRARAFSAALVLMILNALA